MVKFTHFDEEGKARMVDVSAKPATLREAVASGRIVMKPETLRMIGEGQVAKGDVLGVARLAGIMAAKRTGDLIPLCHPLPVTSITIEFALDEPASAVDIKSTVKTVGQTGVEMEALVAASVAALTIYDMCKAADREMIISDIKLLRKSGGKSGVFVRSDTRS
ncbi:MAG TPA: cyclic pyranopterin monophosphate synthase MoaC [Dissulfurispiraceae bacterium]|nr:cyclic pyranopterin monophosphate synthase MoaC [Dissulfurispiraceae bacterium]